MTQRRGITALEILIILGILAILAAILVPNFLNGRARRSLMGCRSNLKNVNHALVEYQKKNSSYPTELGALVPDFLMSMPTCPGGGTLVYTRSGNIDSGFEFVLFCQGEAHSRYELKDYPQFTSERGLIDRPDS